LNSKLWEDCITSRNPFCRLFGLPYLSVLFSSGYAAWSYDSGMSSHRITEPQRDWVGRDLPAPPLPWAGCPPAQDAQGPSMAWDTSRDGAAQLWAVPGPHRLCVKDFLLKNEERRFARTEPS